MRDIDLVIKMTLVSFTKSHELLILINAELKILMIEKNIHIPYNSNLFLPPNENINYSFK